MSSETIKFYWEGDASGLTGSLRAVSAAIEDQKKALAARMAEMRKSAAEERAHLQRIEAERQKGAAAELQTLLSLSRSQERALGQKAKLYAAAETAAREYLEEVKRSEREMKKFGDFSEDTKKRLAASYKEAERLSRALSDAQSPAKGLKGIIEQTEDAAANLARRLKVDVRNAFGDIAKVAKAPMGPLGAAAGAGFGVVNWAFIQGNWDRLNREAIEKYQKAQLSNMGWEMGLKGAGFSDSDVDAIAKENRRLLSVSPQGRQDINVAQTIMATLTKGDVELMNRLTRLVGALDVIAAKDDMGDIAEELQALFGDLDVSPDAWLRMGATKEMIEEFRPKLELLRNIPRLEREIAMLQRDRDLSPEGAQRLKDMRAQLALGRQYERENVPMQWVEQLEKRYSGMQTDVANKVLFLWWQGEWDEFFIHLGHLADEWAGDYYSDLGTSLALVNDALDRVDSVLELMGYAKEAFSEGVFSDTIAKFKETLLDSWEGLREVLLAAWDSLVGVVTEGGRIVSLYIEDAIVRAIRNIPGVGKITSRLEDYDAMAQSDAMQARKLIFAAASKGDAKAQEAIARQADMRASGASDAELDRFVVGQADRIIDDARFRPMRNPAAFDWGAVTGPWGRLGDPYSGRVAQDPKLARTLLERKLAGGSLRARDILAKADELAKGGDQGAADAYMMKEAQKLFGGAFNTVALIGDEPFRQAYAGAATVAQEARKRYDAKRGLAAGQTGAQIEQAIAPAAPAASQAADPYAEEAARVAALQARIDGGGLALPGYGAGLAPRPAAPVTGGAAYNEALYEQRVANGYRAKAAHAPAGAML